MAISRIQAISIAAALLATPVSALAAIDQASVTRTESSLQIQWQASSGTAVDVYRMDRPGQRGRLISANDLDGTHSVALPNRRTYFALQTRDGTRTMVGERVVRLYGASNFRDLGGYETTDNRRVRWGSIFRSAALNGLDDRDQPLLSGLNIAAIYDLRSTSERAAEPTRWPWRRRPVLATVPYEMDISQFASGLGSNPTPEGARALMTAFYPRIVDSHKQQFTQVFEQLLSLRRGRAFVFHCTAGKDRTGVATALVLTALGVPRDTILQDFELSNEHYRGRIQSGEQSQSAATNPLSRLPPDVMAVFMGVDRVYLEAFFASVETTYGSVDAYLAQELGVDAADIRRLRDLYTEV
jgi:protein-tyrosine phosphatase